MVDSSFYKARTSLVRRNLVKAKGSGLRGQFKISSYFTVGGRSEDRGE
jgi:hypothetical protein